MSDCGCEKAQNNLEEYLHNELCNEEAAEIWEHLKNCEGCCDEFELGLVITEAVRRACNENAPDLTRIDILKSIRGQC